MHKYWLLAAQIIASLGSVIALSSNPTIAIIALLNGVCWVVCNQRRWFTYGALGLFLFLALSVLAFIEGQAIILGIISGISALLAWDLERFEQRLQQVDSLHNQQQLIQQHLRYALSASGAGLLVALISSQIRLNIGFWWLCGVLIIGIVLLNRLLSSLNKANE